MKIPTILVAILAVFISTSTAQAAENTFTATTTIAFTVNFEMTAIKGALELPIMASNRINSRDQGTTIGYQIDTDDTADKPTTVSAALISATPINAKQRYELVEGETGDFILLVIATYSEVITEPAQIHVTRLPYWSDSMQLAVSKAMLKSGIGDVQARLQYIQLAD